MKTRALIVWMLGQLLMWAAATAEEGYRVEEIAAGCAHFGADIRTCAGSFHLETDAAGRARDESRYLTIDGRWALSDRGFMERSTVVYPPLSPEEEAEYERAQAEWDEARKAGRNYNLRALRRHGSYVTEVFFDGEASWWRRYRPGEQERHSGSWGRGEKALGAEISLAAQSSPWLGLASLQGQELPLAPRPRPPLPTLDQDLSIVGTEVASGRECVKVVGRLPLFGIYHITWWIAPQCDYLIMRCDQVTYPGQGDPNMKPGERKVLRWRVLEVGAFGDSVFLPLRAEQVLARVSSDGSTVAVLGRERFRAANVKVNQLVRLDLFEVPERMFPGRVLRARFRSGLLSPDGRTSGPRDCRDTR